MSENALGKATSGTSDSGKDSSVECPTCGRDDFASPVGLGMHRRREHGEDASAYPRLEDREWLKEQYHDDFMTQPEIAEEVGCTPRTVSEYLTKHEIATRSGGRQGNTLEQPLSDSAKSVLRGELLGDGCIATRYENSHTAWYAHGTSREGYRDWLSEWLEQQGFYVRTAENPNNGFEDYEPKAGYNLSTRGYRCLYRMRERWYPGGEKRVPDDLQLTPLMLRHWYIGDGSHMQEWDQIRLHSEGFSRECTKRLVRALSWVGITAHVQANNAIFIPTRSYERFFDYMAPLPEELEGVYGYKWP